MWCDKRQFVRINSWEVGKCHLEIMNLILVQLFQVISNLHSIVTRIAISAWKALTQLKRYQIKGSNLEWYIEGKRHTHTHTNILFSRGRVRVKYDIEYRRVHIWRQELLAWTEYVIFAIYDIQWILIFNQTDDHVDYKLHSMI